MTDTQADKPAAAPAPAPVDTMSFEDALRELEAIVETLEQGRGSLDDAIAAYERGAALKKHCQKKLEEARLKVEKIKLDESGQPSGTTDFDA
ncbi:MULTISPECIES: exodeoxyribonuclease VII small subunit [Thalassobaculum]|uniref:Exodeoxyribonuclease 7 small subunit n=1 Tax=Thalassobaculum litoreum DSM 18839 TaxID=1123362 RepID=A0A8G2BMU9_9PROT|nr:MULTISPECIES: exodeoxyribonuclease VII small subunit [Thalassobaculum]SDG43857.1 Exodeoxyribonuclease VII small subunit [Thalassobaculum litoreum DSM 18839]